MLNRFPTYMPFMFNADKPAIHCSGAVLRFRDNRNLLVICTAMHALPSECLYGSIETI